MAELKNDIHIVSLTNREKIDVTSALEVLSSTEKEVYVKLESDTMQIVGENLKIVKLVPDDKILSVTGKICGVNYVSKMGKKSFLKKVFK